MQAKQRVGVGNDADGRENNMDNGIKQDKIK